MNEECLELSDYLPKYGNILYDELKKLLKREPNQYEYDNYIDFKYEEYLDKFRD